ncbi:hypothetical protein ACWIHQ_25070 [Streptomyces anulatus]
MAGRLAAPLHRRPRAPGRGAGPGRCPARRLNGCDVGTWTRRQTDPDVWNTLLPEQSDRLTALGLIPRPFPAAPAGKGAGASVALTQYAAREGRVVVPRTHIEETPHGAVRLGTCISNTRSRREKLSTEQRAALGIDWTTET